LLRQQQANVCAGIDPPPGLVGLLGERPSPVQITCRPQELAILCAGNKSWGRGSRFASTGLSSGRLTPSNQRPLVAFRNTQLNRIERNDNSKTNDRLNCRTDCELMIHEYEICSQISVYIRITARSCVFGNESRRDGATALSASSAFNGFVLPMDIRDRSGTAATVLVPLSTAGPGMPLGRVKQRI
jgi:hypothetical protein